ncbi:MAG: protein-L-isoaspartate O-methyltransferase [Candidatus Paceibacterota bacterium]
MNTTDIFEDDFLSQDELLTRLEEKTSVLKNERIQEAFKAIDRRDFVRSDYQIEAYEDYPLPIGEGQTISQPTTIAFMLELLDPQEGDVVLDIGSGSGYTTALLGYMVGKTGKVIGLEIYEDLIDFSRENLEKYNMDWVEVRKSEGGVPEIEEAPLDRVLVSAGAEEIPQALIDQLKAGGVIVLPIKDMEDRDTLLRIEKEKTGKLIKKSFPGFRFVPFQQ